MKLPSFTRIIMEDLPTEVQKWVDKLVNPINSFMLTIRTGLNKNLTINENLSGAIKTVLVINGAVSFRYTSSRKPTALLVGKWYNKTDNTWTPTTGIDVSWSYNGIDTITATFYGLENTNDYNITLVILDD